MIDLKSFLQLKNIDVDFKNAKIHCATSKKNPPLNAFYRDYFKEWQESQTKKNFNRSHIISLIHVSGKKWLYAGVYKVNGEPKKITKNKSTTYKYSTTLLKDQKDHIGKIIVEFDKTFRASYLKAESFINNISIIEILEHKKSIDEFPGFNNVKVSYQELATIFKLREESWLGALANIKGVYLITDLKGKCHYVGSATGSDGIWSRWQAYIKNGHGNNTELRSLIKKYPTRSQSFQFSILEIADSHTSDNEIIKRESYWKDALGSRLFGHNRN